MEAKAAAVIILPPRMKRRKATPDRAAFQGKTSFQGSRVRKYGSFRGSAENSSAPEEEKRQILYPVDLFPELLHFLC